MPASAILGRPNSFCASAIAAQAMPWEPTQFSLYRTIFPQMTNFLPDEEGAQLRFSFDEEIRRFLAV